MTIKVLLADDQSLVRSGFRMLIDSADDMEAVGEVDNGRDAVAVVRTRPVDVVLMDIRMPIMDGIESTERMLAASTAGNFSAGPAAATILAPSHPLVFFS